MQKQIALLGLITATFIAIVFYFFYIPHFGPKPASNSFIVGTNVGYAPFIFADEKGTYVGYDVEVMEAIGKKLGKDVVWKDMAYEALLIELGQHKVDMICGGITITPAVKAKTIAVEYAPAEEYALLFWKKIPEGVSDIKSFVEKFDKTITTQEGTLTFIDYIEKEGGMVKTFETYNDILLDLSCGQSKAGFCDFSVARYFKKFHPLLEILPLKDSQKGREGVGILFTLAHQELAKTIEKAVQELENEGVLSKLREKWFGEKNA